MSRPPKMRLPYAPTRLRLVDSESSTDTAGEAIGCGEERGARVYRGIAYPVQQWRDWLEQSGRGSGGWESLIGGYRLDTVCGEILPFEDGGPAWCWDSVNLGRGRLVDNEFQLQASSVDDLSIEEGVDCALLSITPRFAVRYKTHAFPAQLGEIRLVNASRFVTDVNGDRHCLLDTEAAGRPVLYREGVDDTRVIRQCTDWQPVDTEQDYNFDYRISQVLRRDLVGVDVQSITVLEQYSSYFMQRAVAASAGQALWVPACAPIAWGWSLRVEPEADDWVITRRKLIMPVVGHDGWQMPQWQGSTIDYLAN